MVTLRVERDDRDRILYCFFKRIVALGWAFFISYLFLFIRYFCFILFETFWCTIWFRGVDTCRFAYIGSNMDASRHSLIMASNEFILWTQVRNASNPVSFRNSVKEQVSRVLPRASCRPAPSRARGRLCGGLPPPPPLHLFRAPKGPPRNVRHRK